ncbi:hypothetical protein OG735_38800 [Streptomyces sp. NBC_01210]|uniref:hypothetical protein n=1 Tax=Streptomyces sp. NBC_01210 TaxID=2903774 RepID=UPI002E11AD1A|nr:hypothetical protein OG735_38800 [Streptomyces sp. NBC_01210]
MYNMRAEHLAAKADGGLLWHVLDRNGRALCGRVMNSKAISTADAAYDRDDYCTSCMNAVGHASSFDK